MDPKEILTGLVLIKEHFEALKMIDDSGTWDEHIRTVVNAEMILGGE